MNSDKSRLICQPWPEVKIDKLGGTLAHTPREIFARDDEILPALVLAAYDDVRVRMSGIEVIDGHPVEPGSEIFLDACHEAARERFQVLVFGGILSRHDEAKLMAVVPGAT